MRTEDSQSSPVIMLDAARQDGDVGPLVDLRADRAKEAEVELAEKIGKTPAEDTDTDEGLGGRTRMSKVKKVRRARRKAYKPYYQLTEAERTVREERERLRELKQSERMLAKGRITAPYNTTQFLMSDHSDNILLSLEKKLESRKALKARMRESSEDGALYSSHSDNDNEDFIRNQFNSDYQAQHLNRLENMSHEQLLSELILLERKNEALEEKLEFMRGQEEEKVRRGLVDYDFEKGEVPMDPETAEKIQIFQQEIDRLQSENTRLNSENMEMKERLEKDKESSSESSSSSSDSSDSSSDDSSDEEEEKNKADEGPPEDTGYESTQSKEDTPNL